MLKSALPLMLLSTAALAQTAPVAPPSDTDQIVVTGTRAPGRTVLDSPVPVDVLSGATIEQAGFQGEVAQALQLLTPSLNFPRQNGSGAGDTIRAAQLRGLSPDQTLVLVDGRRYHNSSGINLSTKIGLGTAPVDLNTLPLNAIGRAEILRDGAGAQYGSDAIAGVINIILDNAPGTTVTTSYGLNVTNPPALGIRIVDGQTWNIQAKHGIKFGDGGFLVVGGDYLLQQGTNRAGFDQGGEFLTGGDGNAPANLALTGQRLFKVGDPHTDSAHLWYNAELPVGDLTLYSYGIGHYRRALGANFFRWPVLLAGDGTDYVSPVQPNGFRPVSDIRNGDFQALVGARGTPGGWRLDGSVGYGQNFVDYRLYNSANYSLGADSPTRFQLSRTIFNQLTINGDAQRELDLGLFKPATIAFGGEYRHEWWRSRAGDPASYALGPLATNAAGNYLPGGAQAGPGLTAADVRALQRDVVAGYAEASAQATRTVFVDLAGRVEHFSDIRDTSVAGKVAARWEFAPGYAVRGSVSNSFKAPGLAQLGTSATSLNFGTGGALANIATLPFDNPAARALGATKLRPETSFNLSAGLTARPVARVRITGDFFRIDIDNRITLSEQFNLSGLTPEQSAALGVQNYQGINFFTNAVDLRTQGFEGVLDYSARVFGGRFTASAAGSYYDNSIRRIHAAPPQLAQYGIVGGLVGVEAANTLTTATPDSKIVLQGAWAGDIFNGLLRITRFGRVTRTFDFGGGFTPTQTYPADWTVDTEVGATIRHRFTLAVGANNLFDVYPPGSIGDFNGSGNLAYDVISPIGTNGRFVYARAGVKF